MFALFWVNYAILCRYYLEENWGAALPGLDSTLWLKWTMGGYFICGAISLLVGPFQFMGIIRTRYTLVHRWTGRLYVVSAVAACCFGCTIILLQGKLVGWWNMSISFFCAGVTIGVLAFQTWKSARTVKENLAFGAETSQLITFANFDVHRNWGIRSYSQILSPPMLYRYWYAIVELFGLYDAPETPEMGGVCHADGSCPDYYRWFDQLHCWTFWPTSSLLVAELIIHNLPASKRNVNTSTNQGENTDSICPPSGPSTNQASFFRG